VTVNLNNAAKRIAAAIAILALFSAAGFAQDDPGFDSSMAPQINRVLGDQYLNIGIGMQIPLFIHNPSPESGETAINPTNLKLGLTGSLGWAAFLNNNISLGLDVAAAYSADVNKAGFFTVPFTINAAYFLRSSPFEIPIHLGFGMNIMKYKDITTLGIMAKSGVSLYWNAIQDWSFGLNLMYWWMPEIYSKTDGEIPTTMTRIGNFLEVTVSAMYNF
jgi:hypothetical protein